MPVIVKLPPGNWRAQVRRKGKYISNTFRRRADAYAWALGDRCFISYLATTAESVFEIEI
jgi:hypothetical protein